MYSLLLSMSEIQVKDKVFEPFIKEEALARRVEELSEEINEAYAGKNPLLVPVLNGAFLFAADLIRGLKIEPEIQFFRVSTYGDRMTSSQQAELILGKEIDVKDRHVLLIEDIVDTGHTCDFLMDYVRSRGAASIKLVCLLYKPDTHSGKNLPDYVGFEIPPAFVVGYGLDYAQRGRELNAIYRLKAES